MRNKEEEVIVKMKKAESKRKEKGNELKKWIFREDWPTRKMERMSVQNLTDAEAIAVILGTGFKTQEKKKNAIDIAYKLLEYAGGSLDSISRMDYREISKVEGIGEKKAKKLVCAMELGRRQCKEVKTMKQINSSMECAEVMQAMLQNKTKEEFWVLDINHSNRIIKKTKMAEGGYHDVYVDIRCILKEAIISEATGIVVCHNHPSGDTEPSEADIKLTNLLKTSANTMGIRLLDHIIVSKEGYFSFSDARML